MTVRGVARALYVLQYGAERVPKTLSVPGLETADGTQLGWEPLIGVLVDTEDGWVLFDTGMSRATHDDPATDRAYAGPDPRAYPDVATTWHLHPRPPDPARWTWGRPGEPVQHALAELGLEPSDISLAVLSHLHWDHSGGVGALTDAGVEVLIHCEELAFARSGDALASEGFAQADWGNPKTRWAQMTRTDELVVAPGVTVLATPGHTPGHLSLRVDLRQTGTWLFTADAADLGQNLLEGRPCGSCTGGGAQARERSVASLRRLFEVAAGTGARLVPGHDQVVTTAVRAPPGGHR